MHALDHNAGGPVDPRVLARFLEIERACPGNPASAHQLGRRARAVVEDARTQVAAALAVAVDDVVFCSGGTEANNLAVLGLGDRHKPVAMAPVEHPSVVEAARARGIAWWSVDCDGLAQPQRTEVEPGLLCLVHAQSEVGAIQPVAVAAAIADEMKVPLHVDAAQSLGRIALGDVVRVASSVSISPHKCGGLRGSGVLLVRDAERALHPLLRGGSQEHGLRPGTTSPSLAAATALAIELAVQEQPQRAERMASARDAFVHALALHGIEHRVLTTRASLPNTAMIAFARVDGRALLPTLDLESVCASHGSACSSGSPQPPAVLLAMGLTDAEARACVRFSFGADTTADDARDAAMRVARGVARVQKKN